MMMIQDKMNNSDNHTESESLSIGLVTQVTKQSERSFYAVFLFCKKIPGGQIGPFKKTYKAQKPFKVKDIKMCLI